jgi:hypothetical protein
LVDIQQSKPKRFTPVSAETTVRKFDEERRRRTGVLATALDHLEPVSPRKEQQGVWTVEGQTAVTDRVLEFFADADSEIVYMTVEDLLTEELVDGLREAADRGVSIKLAGLSPEVQERIREEIPGADLFESLWVWSDTPAGRLLMVDGSQTLVSVLTNGRHRSPPGPQSETAIWGAGETNSLVVVLRAIFTWRLGGGGKMRTKRHPNNHENLTTHRRESQTMDTPEDSPDEDSETGETVRAEYEWSSTAPSTGVVETIARATDRDPTTLDPLFETVDLEALDALLGADERTTAGETVVSFQFSEREITVSSTGEVVVRAQSSE